MNYSSTTSSPATPASNSKPFYVCSAAPPTPQPAPKEASFIQAITATWLQDTVIYLYPGVRRCVWRLVFLLAAVLTLTGLTTARYLTSSDLRSGLVVSRTLAINDIGSQGLTRDFGTCPCQVASVAWSRMYKADGELIGLLDSEGGLDSFALAQCTKLHNKSIDLPTRDEVIDATLAHNMTLDALQAAYGELMALNDMGDVTANHLCIGSLGALAPHFNATGQKYAGQEGREGLTSSVLMPPTEIQANWENFVRSTIRAQVSTLANSQAGLAEVATMLVRILMCIDSDLEECQNVDQGALDIMSEALAASESSGAGATGAALGQNAELGAMATILSGSLRSMAKLSAVITAVGFAQQAATSSTYASTSKYAERIPATIRPVIQTSIDLDLTLLIQDFIFKHVTLDFDSYVEVCQPVYCDRVEVKTLLTRIIEFLSTVGGLWTIIFGATMILWTVVNFFDLPARGYQPGAFEVWH